MTIVTTCRYVASRVVPRVAVVLNLLPKDFPCTGSFPESNLLNSSTIAEIAGRQSAGLLKWRALRIEHK